MVEMNSFTNKLEISTLLRFTFQRGIEKTNQQMKNDEYVMYFVLDFEAC